MEIINNKQTSLLNWTLTSRLTDFGLPRHILPGASPSCASMPIGHTNQWQDFLDLVFPMQTIWSIPPTSADPRIKYSSHTNIILHSHSCRTSAAAGF